tara:strand:+ start:708 stop:842 length:135 start_codon:yes stop_codon:yes gene_type:complete
MGTLKTVKVTDSKGNTVVVNEEDAGKYRQAPAPKETTTKKPQKR